MVSSTDQLRPKPTGPCSVVIFGASGDLTKRKLLPALYNLFVRGLLPGEFAIVGVARREWDDDSFRAQIENDLRQFATQTIENSLWSRFRERIYYCCGAFDQPQTFACLTERLTDLDKRHHTAGNHLFYLATQASSFVPIAQGLAKARLLEEANDNWRRVIVEKPFGHDLASAQELNRQLRAILKERQIYRIDHYLGKETVQNLLVFRFGNGIFEPVWNRNYIDHVQITMAETIGIEGRGAFYENAGAMRDVVQNHVFVLLALICMEPPRVFQGDAVRNEMVKVIESVKTMTPVEILAGAIRGQYGAGQVNGRAFPAYQSEKNVAPDSLVETYVALRLFLANWRWGGVPFYLRTGKSLACRSTRIVVEFKSAPQIFFDEETGGSPVGPNRLIIDIQPREAITVQMRAKTPGQTKRTQSVKLDFDYKDFGEVNKTTGYETLLYDAMTGDNTLFHRTDMVEAAWRVASPIMETWATQKPTDFPNYSPSSAGPTAADKLIEQDGRHWWPLE